MSNIGGPAQRSAGRGVRATTQISTRAAPACCSTRGDSARVAPVVITSSTSATRGRAARRAARLDGEGAAHVGGARARAAGRAAAACRARAAAARVGAAAQARARDAPRDLPRLVEAALAQARRRERHRQQQVGPARAALRAAGDERASAKRRRQVEPPWNLNPAIRRVPRIAVVEAASASNGGGVAQAGAADGHACGHRQGAARAARRGARSARTQAAQTGRGPSARQTAHRPAAHCERAACRRGARGSESQASRSIYCPPMADRPIAPRGAPRSDAAAARRLRRMARAPRRRGCTTRWRGAWPSGCDRSGLQPRALLDWWAGLGAGTSCCGAAYPQARAIVARRARAALARAPRVAAHGRGGPRRSRGARRDEVAPKASVPAAASCVWANMVLHARRRSAGAVRPLARLLAVDGFLMFSCLGPDTLRELRELYARSAGRRRRPDFIDMHDLGDMLVAGRLRRAGDGQGALTLTWPSAEALLAELRELGGKPRPTASRPAPPAGAPPAARSLRAPAPTDASPSPSRSSTATPSSRRRASGGGRLGLAGGLWARCSARRGGRAPERVLIRISARRGRIGYGDWRSRGRAR